MSSYGSPPPPPPGGAGPYGGTGPYGDAGRWPTDHPQGTTVLVLGILSLVVCAPLGIVAIIMGNTALKEIDASPGSYSNRQTVQIGRILGIVGTVLLVITVLFVLLIFVVAMGTATASDVASVQRP